VWNWVLSGGWRRFEVPAGTNPCCLEEVVSMGLVVRAPKEVKIMTEEVFIVMSRVLPEVLSC
jgi:hypothetical protein